VHRDGSLCIYDASPEHPGAFRWGTLEKRLGVDDFYAVMQSDWHLSV
jgi:hypothetical protein